MAGLPKKQGHLHDWWSCFQNHLTNYGGKMKKNYRRLIFAIAAAVISMLMLHPAFVYADNDVSSHKHQYIADELLIKPKQGVARQKIDNIIKSFGASTEDEIPQIRVKRIKVPSHAAEKVERALSKNPHIQFVEKNFIAKASEVPNDPYYGKQWHMETIWAPEGWGITTGSAEIPIAIIDSGVDPDQSDLMAKLIPGYNFVGGNTDTTDLHGHGTAVAGSAAAATDNSKGIAGVAWLNPIMPLVVLNSSGYATYYDVAKAINYAADNGVRVINISLGGPDYSSTLQNAVNYAWDKGAIIFASAGNSSSDTPNYPAACNNVVAVSATDSNDKLASFSSYGNWVDISAPGSYIYTTKDGGGYGYWNGTSFASPITAGLAALILSLEPTLTNQQVYDLLTRHADDLGTAGFDPYFGYGRINVYKSLYAAFSNTPPADKEPPAVHITSPEDGSAANGQVAVTVSATDNSEVTEVQLYINGELHAWASEAPYDFSFDTAQYVDGAHTLQAFAYDSSGNKGESSINTVYVDNSDDTPDDPGIEEPVSDPEQVSVTSVTYFTDGGRLKDRHLSFTASLTNDGGMPVSGASLSIILLCNSGSHGTWSYVGNTDSMGKVTFSLNNAPSGCYTAEVTDVTISGWTWDGITPVNSFCK
jgi:thermitase